MKKLFALFIAIVMAFSMTAGVYADETSGDITEEATKEVTEEITEEDVSVHIAKKFEIGPGNWTSSNEKIAVVKGEKIVGVSPGKCQITDGEYTYNVTVKKRAYKRSSKYYPITQTIELPSSGYSLSTKNIGLKVIKVNKTLRGSYSERYTAMTKQAVKTFQRRKGLKVTGVVNKKTWLKMGLSEKSWYSLGTYITPIKVDGSSKRKDYINAMIDAAKEYAEAGTRYKVGCSGKPGTYADCSGLIYQCLYAAGINPDTNIVDHALAKYEYTSRWLAKDKKLGKVVTSKKIGDLLFYGDPVYHVAIYAGNGYIYDSVPKLGVTKRKSYKPVSKIIRVFE